MRERYQICKVCGWTATAPSRPGFPRGNCFCPVCHSNKKGMDGYGFQQKLDIIEVGKDAEACN